MTRVIKTTVHGAMRKVLLMIAVIAAGASAPLPASAQDGSGWGAWDGPRSARQRQPANDRWYDERDDEYYERSYERPVEPPVRNRRYQQRWDPDDDWGDGTTYERRYDARRAPPQYQIEDESGQDEASGQTQSPRGPDGKPIGQNGGARPVIQAIAPEVTSFARGYAPGSTVIDTGGRKLYYVRDAMSAFVYPIGVGRDGFSWSGSEKVSRIADWPDWYPPAEMRKRKPELPERMLGGLNNPLGAKAIYLGNTLYRIHGTNDPKSIGRAESSGCFRMLNGHVLHLASLVQVGAEVSVVRSLAGAKVAAVKPPAQAAKKPAQVQRPRNARVQWSADDDYDDTVYEPDNYRY